MEPLSWSSKPLGSLLADAYRKWRTQVRTLNYKQLMLNLIASHMHTNWCYNELNINCSHREKPTDQLSDFLKSCSVSESKGWQCRGLQWPNNVRQTCIVFFKLKNPFFLSAMETKTMNKCKHTSHFFSVNQCCSSMIYIISYAPVFSKLPSAFYSLERNAYVTLSLRAIY